MDSEVDDDLVQLVGSRNSRYFDHGSHSHLKTLELINRNFLVRIVHVFLSSHYAIYDLETSPSIGDLQSQLTIGNCRDIFCPLTSGLPGLSWRRAVVS